MNSDKKFTVNVAYTTPSGRMHVGHGLGHVVADVALRYGALRQGKETFFGFGMHSTGKDLIKILTTIRDETNLPETLSRYNITVEKREEILSLDNLDDQIDLLVQEYMGQYREVIEKMGIAMDYDSFFSTNQEANQRYTQWTLRRLNEAGLIVETESDRPYCPQCDDIKHIDRDLSEVSAVGSVDWDEVRVADGQIYGGEFECRLHGGERIIVKRRKERAINYADSEMQQKTLSLARTMKVFPRKYKQDLEGIVRTRIAKPFERKANGNIGALSPFDSEKRVEALSDSNIYMEFFSLSQLLNQGVVEAENLTDSFFDYVYLGRGIPSEVFGDSGVDEKTLEKVKAYINSVSPVDISIAGHEHLGVHLPFSLFVHAAVLPEEFFFPECIITSHITRDGEKMSKSKGNVVYLDDLLRLVEGEGSFGALSEDASLDAIRFFLSYYQSLDKDFDWDDNKFRTIGLKGVSRYVTGISHAAASLGTLKLREPNLMDKWFLTMDQRTIGEISDRMEEKDSRMALVNLVDLRNKALNRYIKSGPNPEILSNFLINQINLGYPVMPRITEELRNRYFQDESLEWPRVDGNLEFPEEYEVFEHEIKGKSYEKNLVGDVMASLSKMLGKKEIQVGDSVVITCPTQHQLEVLSKQKIPLFKGINIEFSTDPMVNGVEVKRR